MPVLFGLCVEIHKKKHGASDETCMLGIYFTDEASRFNLSVLPCNQNAALRPTECREATYTHFVADNVDHNLRTLDGCDTIHCMAIIAVRSFSVGHDSAPLSPVCIK